MANIFTKNQTNTSFTPRQLLENKYKVSRANLLLVLAFTAINLILLLINSNTYFLFSAFIPYFIADLGMLMCGKYPAEFYVDDFAGMEFLDTSFLVVMVVIAFAVLALYLLAWFLSKNNKVGWLIFALILFGIDTVLMFLLSGISVSSIFDILFHAWVIYELAVGIHAHYKLKALPPEEAPAPSDAFDYFGTENQN